MSLTSCRECGAAVPASSHTCPSCGAAMAPVPYAVRPAPPRPPEPERPWWRTVGGWGSAIGWAAIVGVCVLIAVAFVRGSAESGRRKTEKAEVRREEEHLRRVFVWTQDTTWAIIPDSGRRPVPTTEGAKRIWVISQMLLDRWAWERQVMERHGVSGDTTPTVMGTTRYQGNARDYPQVGAYLEGRAAAIAEIEKASAGWVQERMAALARESGLPAGEVRGLFPTDFGGKAADDARHVNAMLEIHRHYVRVDPRVSPSGSEMLTWQREDEARRAHELATRVNAAANDARQARARRITSEQAAFSRVVQVTG
ncbi:MAG TPA: zinc ribbon domain-containing protein [Longimicrobium sp.]|nr:zinc ribbon domain-containing protein [Longimicrobium sp.]